RAVEHVDGDVLQALVELLDLSVDAVAQEVEEALEVIPAHLAMVLEEVHDDVERDILVEALAVALPPAPPRRRRAGLPEDVIGVPDVLGNQACDQARRQHGTIPRQPAESKTGQEMATLFAPASDSSTLSNTLL